MTKLSSPILVTGAGGFIGSHLVERLVASSHRVRAFVRYNSTGSNGWLAGLSCEKEIEVIRGDIRDYDSVRAATAGCGTVFHLAALIGIPYSYESPLAYLKTNVEGTHNVLEACRQQRVDNVIVTSTSEVYGAAKQFPISEEHPVRARSPYAASKIAADQWAISYHAAFGLPVKIVRPFNTFGPRQSARAIIPTVITQILSGAKTIRLGNLHPTRDWTFVEDVAAAFERIAEKETLTGEVTHIASGSEVSIREFVGLATQMLGSEVKIEVDPERSRPDASELARLVGDSSKLRSSTGWKPSRDFTDGVEATIAWIRKNTAAYPTGRYVT